MFSSSIGGREIRDFQEEVAKDGATVGLKSGNCDIDAPVTDPNVINHTDKPFFDSLLSVARRLTTSAFQSRPEFIEIKMEGLDLNIEEEEDISIVKDSYHDLTVVVTQDKKTFRFSASRMVLSLSSPVLHSMLKTVDEYKFPPGAWVEELFSGDSRPKLHLEGDPNAVGIILLILHYQGSEEFRSIDWQLFIKLSAVCERYEWKNALQPWIWYWLSAFTRNALKPGYENWLYVANVYGHEKKVKELVAALADEVYGGSECGTYIMRREKCVDKSLWPAKHVDKILYLREVELRRLTHALKLLVASIQYGSAEHQRLCGLDACADYSVSSLQHSIAQNGLAPLVETDTEWQQSVLMLRERMVAIRFDTLQEVSRNHTCGLKTLGDRFLIHIKGEDSKKREGR